MQTTRSKISNREITLNGAMKIVHVPAQGRSDRDDGDARISRTSPLRRWVRDAGFTVYMPSLFAATARCPAEEGWPCSARLRQC